VTRYDHLVWIHDNKIAVRQDSETELLHPSEAVETAQIRYSHNVVQEVERAVELMDDPFITV